jgi:hypothetical protein
MINNTSSNEAHYQGIHYHYPDDDDDSGKNVVNVLTGIRITKNNLAAFHHQMIIQTQNILLMGCYKKGCYLQGYELYSRNNTQVSWEKKHAFSFLGVETVNKKETDLICEHTMNCRNYTHYETNQELYPEEFAAINDLRVLNPSLFGMWPIPPLWKRGYDLRTHSDVPMHLLFLGIVKTIVRMIQAWCGLRGRTESFITCFWCPQIHTRSWVVLVACCTILWWKTCWLDFREIYDTMQTQLLVLLVYI